MPQHRNKYGLLVSRICRGEVAGSFVSLAEFVDREFAKRWATAHYPDAGNNADVVYKFKVIELH